MTVAFEDLLTEVLPETPECPGPLAVNAVRNAAIDFCQRSTFWRQDHAKLSAFADEGEPGEYTLTVPSDTELVAVVTPILMSGLPVYQRSQSWLDQNLHQWQMRTGAQADWFLMVSPTILRLVPYPVAVAVDALQIKLILKPSREAAAMDATTANQWYLTITAGAKSLLMAMGNKPWSDQAESERYSEIFEHGITEARSRIIGGHRHQAADRVNKSRGHYF